MKRHSLRMIPFALGALLSAGTLAQAISSGGGPAVPPQAVNEQAIIPETALRVFDSLYTGTVWNFLVNQPIAVPWVNPGGDWRDRNGSLQGGAPWSSAVVRNVAAEQIVTFDVTSLVKSQIPSAVNGIPNRGWIIKNDAGDVSAAFYSREYAVTTKRPTLRIMSSSGPYTIVAGGDVSMSSSTAQSTHGLETTLGLSGSKQRLALWFDLASVRGTINSATLSLTTTVKQYGGGTSTLGVYPVDLTASFAPIAVQTGLASRYPFDSGIERDPDVLFSDKFPDLAMHNRGWYWDAGTPVINDNRAIIGDIDPADVNYHPLAAGIKAYKMTIPTGHYGGEFGRWSFWSNLGYEPDAIYMRVYARIGSNFDSEAGKFPFGFDGTYLQRAYLNYNGQSLATNPVTGRKWIRPDAPASAGNGGATSNGKNGWSARGGFTAEECDTGGNCATSSTSNPLIASGYRGLHYYAYWADQPDAKGSDFNWRNGLLGIIPKNKWVAIDQYMKLNTVNTDGSGNKDGILRAWIDGRLAFEKTDFRVRNWPGNPVGANNIKFDSVWLNLYHGGLRAAKSPMTVYLSDLVVAKSFIGPARF